VLKGMEMFGDFNRVEAMERSHEGAALGRRFAGAMTYRLKLFVLPAPWW
jgi:hypothetical protein